MNMHVGTGSEQVSESGLRYRLEPSILAIVADIARGVEEGEAGLKSCGLVESSVAAGVALRDATRMQPSVEEIDDEDECFNAIGDLLASGFSFAEVHTKVRLSAKGVRLLDLEQWCERAKLVCDADAVPPSRLASTPWKASRLHERRLRGRRAMQRLRSTPDGAKHAAVLHIVYGAPDPFVLALPVELREGLGAEFAPLARYTDAVEEKRQELVKAEAGRGARAGDQYRTDGHMREMARRDGFDPDNFAVLVDLSRYRQRLAWADRTISSGDALRAVTLREERQVLVTRVRIEANRVLSEASRAFRDAWDAG